MTTNKPLTGRGRAPSAPAPILELENWLPIANWPGYEVSDLGRVRSPRGRVMCPDMGWNRYLRVQVQINGKRSGRAIHRLVMDAFVGPLPPGCVTRHLNGDRTDNRLVNLRFGTHQENIRDSFVHGTHRMANRTHCKHGHEWTPENTGNQAGYRRCLTCQRIQNKKRRTKAT